VSNTKGHLEYFFSLLMVYHSLDPVVENEKVNPSRGGGKKRESVASPSRKKKLKKNGGYSPGRRQSLKLPGEKTKR